ncbi:hypothetical protein JANAI62_35690 [Jannaschia pagri]|uniref:Site-specific DNA recombinase n=1 Tax=Jannaschia pagri TaxID=2829797 RepID=A0ABQ4NRG8_9RHOB|nr:MULTISPECIES: recombinase family protein [unclassified Jannaschia]GIT93147.1 hypothetical protein JANAI61_36050 [Jannaschia sp. AI_61]GIT96946.1 hypothetical protein JANAI62_35690 [Jannaschia sp. AI_62]
MQDHSLRIQTAQQRAVIYARVSSIAQETEGHGLKSQETRCREYALSKGYDVAAVFPDTISGGGDFMKRPGMVALLSFLDAQPDTSFVVIFDDLKRFARDTRFHLDLREAFRTRGATIECLNFKFEDTPEGEFIETIMAAQGALERKQNGRQVAQKMKARMQNGYWIHNPPVGYRYQTVRGHGKLLIPNPPLDEIIMEAFEGFACGRFHSQADVARFLQSHPEFPRNKHGVVTQKRAVDVLTQPIYTGHICSERYGLHWLKGHHQPLISVDTFEKVQQRRAEATYAPKRKNIGEDFALRGFVCCDGCGAPLRSSWPKGKYKRYAYYLCQTKGCDSYGKSIPRDKLEGEVGDLIKTLEPTKPLLALVTKMFSDAWDARIAQAQDKIKAAKRQIADADKQIESLLDRIVGTTNARVISAYEKKISELERAKAGFAEIAANHRPNQGRFEELLELSLRFISSPWKLWETGDINLRRTVIKLTFSGRLNYCRIKGTRTPNLSLPFKALGVFSGIEMKDGAAGEN